jgi:molybdopterin/thiamine biosynthesis adenylyltransferase
VTLSADEARRYARQLVLRGFGGAAQQQLKAARVLVIGAGALGSPAIAYLAAAGVGTLGIADPDDVALSNLQRQVIHTTAGIGAGKAESAAAFVRALNPHVTVDVHAEAVAEANAAAVIARYDVILDGTDTFSARKAIAAGAAACGKKLVSGAVSMFDGQVTVFAPGGPQFGDLYPVEPTADELPSCEAVGILGPVAGIIGTLMAMEAIKLVTGTGEPLVGRLLLYDGRASRFSEIAY